MASVSSKPEPGHRKTWVFRCIAVVVIPLLLLSCLEVGLRIAGFGYPAKALIERDFQGKRLCFPNNQFSWRFFPHQMARDFDPGLTFLKDKPPGAFRIFILGGSAARGTPDQMYYFGRHLEAMLDDMYPDVDFEVYNAAMTAINSHVVREIARDCAKYDPDLFIVYMGNNEVVGPYGPGTVLTPAPPSLSLIRANIAVKSTRIGQFFHLMIGTATQRHPAKQWAGMAMFLEKQVQSASGLLQPVYRSFEKNLQDICRSARRSGAFVIVSNVGVNLRDCPPFASMHRSGLSASDKRMWKEIYQEGVALEVQGEYEQAIERYRSVAKIDDTFAELHFRLGRSYKEIGGFGKAQEHYQRALQNDTLRFRADEQINRIIRTTAEGREEEGIYFVDSVAAFEAFSPHRLAGSELFYEHVHLNFKGNYVLARAIFPYIQPLLPATAEPLGEMLSQQQVESRIAYTEFNEYMDLLAMSQEYVNKPPFTNQLFHDDTMHSLQTELEGRRGRLDLDQCMEQYNQALRINPKDWRLWVKQYQLQYEAKGESNLREQEVKVRKIVSLHPYDRGYQLLGNLLLLQGRFNEAEAALNTSLFMNPVWGEAYNSLAVLALKRNNRADAIRYLREEIKVQPAGSVTTYRLLATQYDVTGSTDKAVSVLRKALEIFPDSQAALAHCQLGEMLNKQGMRDEAMEQMEMALRIDPSLANHETFIIQYNLIRGN